MYKIFEKLKDFIKLNLSLVATVKVPKPYLSSIQAPLKSRVNGHAGKCGYQFVQNPDSVRAF